MDSTPTILIPKRRSEKDKITELQGTVSASRLSLFLQCRLKFFFRYVLEIQKPKTPALHLGGAVHETLKTWNKARWINKPLTPDELYETFRKAWADESEKVKWDDDEQDEQQMAWKLLETYFRDSNLPVDVKPDAVEVPVEADLKHHGLPKLIGILDLVQQRQIIDFKTSATTPNADKVAHTTEVQTCSYAILYRHNTGQREAGIQLHHLVKLKTPKIVITQLPSMSESQQTRLFRLMDAYVTGLDRRDFIPSPSIACFSCEFFNECRRWK